MKLKKIVALLTVAALALCLFAGCAGKTADETTAAPEGNDVTAAPTDKQFKIGVMQYGEFDALVNAYKGFQDGLAEAGYKEGEQVVFNYLTAAADTANCPTIADTLINDGSDLILAIATPSVSALKEKTSDIPVLFTAVTDPVASGLIADYNVPGGNISGTSDMNPVKEQIDLLAEIYPEAKTVAVMYCSSESNSAAQYELAKAALEAKGIECVQKTISAVDEAKSAVESLAGQVDAIYIPTDNTIADAMTTVAAAATGVGLGIICGEAGMVKDGGLATYGIDYYVLGKQTAEMAVKVLESENPLETIASMPVVYQTEGNEAAVNTATAEAIGVTIPESVLANAVIYPEAE